MSFEDEAHEWPAYDGLGDEDDEVLPIQEGDEPAESLDHLVEHLRRHPSTLDYFDQFVQQALFWFEEELESPLLIADLNNVRAALKQSYGPKLRPLLSRPLLRLRQAIDEEDGEMVLHLLIKLSDVLRGRPAPLEKPYWAPKV